MTRRMRMRSATVMGGSVPGVPGAAGGGGAGPGRRERRGRLRSTRYTRGIGVEGWTAIDGVGTYENEDALGQIFAAFGGFVHASIRHRIADGQNTSWALVTMATPSP